MTEKIKLNRDAARRDAIIFGEGKTLEYVGGIQRFEALPAEKAELLIDENFMDENDVQNESPAAAEFVAFAKKYPVFGLDGYAVSADRVDYHVSIEGISKIAGKTLTEDDKRALKRFAKYADEVDIDEGYVWYD